MAAIRIECQLITACHMASTAQYSVQYCTVVHCTLTDGICFFVWPLGILLNEFYFSAQIITVFLMNLFSMKL